jgi:predicted RNase H-like HicB family nuclease
MPDRDTHREAGTPSAFTIDFPATLSAIVRPEEGGGYSAEVPGLPGCITEGETLEELRENLAEAARGWLEVHQELAVSDLTREAFGEPGRR